MIEMARDAVRDGEDIFYYVSLLLLFFASA